MFVLTSNHKKENSIYILSCGTCKLQYPGETETKLIIRLNNHRSFEVVPNTTRR